jgi:putative SOS response-associated peptidase YedK
MCGRFTLSQPPEAIAKQFQLDEVPQLSPRYNIAPTQLTPTVLVDSGGSRQFRALHWGLIPSWAKDAKMGARMINARAETLSEKPAFRSAFKYRRCLIVADGFYEWQQQKQGKQPFYFRLKTGEPFAFAGLWEHWDSSEGEAIDSCTIITTAANEVTRSIHDRMPVILSPSDYELWLDPAVQTPVKLQPLLSPYSADEMTSYPVSAAVNSPRNDRADCVEPLAAT